MHAACKFTLNPFTRLSGVPTDDKSQRFRRIGRMAHRTHERSAEPRDRLVIQRVFSRLPTNAISAKESMGHVYQLDCTRRLLNRHIDDGGFDGADAERL